MRPVVQRGVAINLGAFLVDLVSFQMRFWTLLGRCWAYLGSKTCDLDVFGKIIGAVLLFPGLAECAERLNKNMMKKCFLFVVCRVYFLPIN